MAFSDSKARRGARPLGGRSAIALGLAFLAMLWPHAGQSERDLARRRTPSVERTGDAERNAGVALLPLPLRFERRAGRLALDSTFTISLDGHRSELLERALTRAAMRLRATTGLPIPLVPAAPGTGRLRVRCSGPDPAFLTEQADERYTLDVTPDGAVLSAPGPTGVLRGLASFVQLARLDSVGVGAPAIWIEDAPRFAWRGHLLDVARHFSGPASVLRTLDAMEAVKLNVLHLHLSDHEGFRIESLRYPELHAEPSSGGEYFTQDEIRALVAAARDRGIRIVPEVEMPGHSQSILVARPELAAGSARYSPGRTLDTTNAAFDPTREETYRFVEGLLTEVAGLFPDHAMHVAGDEVSSVHWRKDPAIQAYRAEHGIASVADLQAGFTLRVVEILRRLGKTAVVYDEALHPTLPKDVIVGAWRSSKMVERATAAGHRTIVSAGYYLDHGLPATAYYAVDPLDSRATGEPAAVLEAVQGTPLESFVSDAMIASDARALSAAQRALVIGGEAPLWTELVQSEGVEMHTWPRLAAVAERLWSPATVRDPVSLRERLDVVSTDLALQGLRHRAESREALERLAAGGDVGPLARFAEAVEPQRFLARMVPALTQVVSSPRPGIYFPPMNRFADAIPPESPGALAFNEAAARIAEATESPADRRLVRARLEAWRSSEAELATAAQRSALLREVVPVAARVAELAGHGLTALAALESGRALEGDQAASLRAELAPFVDESLASVSVIMALTLPARPDGLSIAIVPGVTALVEAAAR